MVVTVGVLKLPNVEEVSDARKRVRCTDVILPQVYHFHHLSFGSSFWSFGP
jgi:hypothetical protein